MYLTSRALITGLEWGVVGLFFLLVLTVGHCLLITDDLIGDDYRAEVRRALAFLIWLQGDAMDAAAAAFERWLVVNVPSYCAAGDWFFGQIDRSRFVPVLVAALYIAFVFTFYVREVTKPFIATPPPPGCYETGYGGEVICPPKGL